MAAVASLAALCIPAAVSPAASMGDDGPTPRRRAAAGGDGWPGAAVRRLSSLSGSKGGAVVPHHEIMGLFTGVGFRDGFGDQVVVG